jgi:hypothetical protein
MGLGREIAESLYLWALIAGAPAAVLGLGLLAVRMLG